MEPGQRDSFPPTRPSLVRAIASVDPDTRREAYNALVRLYWRPVYAYIRLRWQRDPTAAQDLTQEFFARAFEKEYLERYDPARARFRTFVRTCLDGFLANERQAATRLKRGGGTVVESMDFASVDGEISRRLVSHDGDPEAWFRREWVRGLFSTAVESLRERCRGTVRAGAFEMFLRYDIEGSDAPTRPTYATLARDFQIPVSDVTNQLAWARRTFRDIVLTTLRTCCATEEELRAEAQDVLGIALP
jgi:RNA polymerase sigma factor (sigma-70 family)